jgi:hypothetical protein
MGWAALGAPAKGGKESDEGLLGIGFADTREEKTSGGSKEEALDTARRQRACAKFAPFGSTLSGAKWCKLPHRPAPKRRSSTVRRTVDMTEVHTQHIDEGSGGGGLLAKPDFKCWHVKGLIFAY